MIIEPAYSDLFGLYKWINADGTRLIFSTDRMLPEMQNLIGVDLVVWDIQNSLYNFPFNQPAKRNRVFINQDKRNKPYLFKE
jgi:hypothetical protein